MEGLILRLRRKRRIRKEAKKESRTEEKSFSGNESNPPREEDWMQGDLDPTQQGESKGTYRDAVRNGYGNKDKGDEKYDDKNMEQESDQEHEDSNTSSEEDEEEPREGEIPDFALTGGPWIILDHYLIVRPWTSLFDPEERIQKLAAWIHLPDLPIELYDKKFLDGDERTEVLDEPKNEKYGGWMTVQRTIRPRRQKPNDQRNTKDNAAGEKIGGGSRFVVLNNNENETSKKTPVSEAKQNEEQGDDGTTTKPMVMGMPTKPARTPKPKENEQKIEETTDAMELGSPVRQPVPRDTNNEEDPPRAAEVKLNHSRKEKPPDTGRKKGGQQKLQGAAGKKFELAFKEFKRVHKPDLVCLFEPRCSGLKAANVIRKLGFPNSEVIEASGFAGGIWALWSKDLSVKCVLKNEQFMHLEIENDQHTKWGFFAIYENPHYQNRNLIWPIIENILSNYPYPFVIARDFNEIASLEEQRGGAPPNIQRCTNFQNWINRCNLIDVVPAGPFFTWEGPKRPGQEKLFKRLDRVLCSTSWRTLFSDASTKRLTKVNLDHHPILLCTKEHDSTPQNRPFRFEACWLQHKDFNAFLKNQWRKDVDYKEMINEPDRKLD
ncbi:ribonuclease H [Senna tora]|uniref:Ribonuclease H n=1 Tax=Senna tora TaxID=362788 RepID=A0A834XHN2_9FABA|nr:ribonuclease H [Senna tora]